MDLRGVWIGGAAALTLLAARPVLALEAPAAAPSRDQALDQVLGREILAELIGIDSTHAFGSTTIAGAIARRLLAAGFAPGDVTLVVPPDHPTKGNVVARLRGSGHAGPPLLYICHLDVVEAPRADWTTDPFVLTEAGGYLYGRGTIDMKGQDAAVLESLIRLRREGHVPGRDVIVAFTADEETGGDASGIDYLLRHRRDLIDAALVINPDVGHGFLENGRHLFLGLQTSEKVYLTYQLEARDAGGHSSRPTPTNPIYRMARALARIEAHPFPVDLTETVKAHFAARAPLESGRAAADMREIATGAPSAGAVERISAAPDGNILLRTTCVATTIHGGQGESALPERVEALIQCRSIPGETEASVRATLAAAIDDPLVGISVFTPATPSPESPPSPKVVDAVNAVAQSIWPGVTVLPIMSAGASDSAFTREVGIPSYGVDGIFGGPEDERAHGRDERVSVAAFNDELEFTYRLMKRLGDAD